MGGAALELEQQAQEKIDKLFNATGGTRGTVC
jgi:hypothetical protein